MGKSKYKKGIDSLDRRIAEHREKQKAAGSQDLFRYFEAEIEKFGREKKKKQKWL